MEKLQDEIIRLALFYADVLLGLDKAYRTTVEFGEKCGYSEELMEELEKNYNEMCKEHLRELITRAKQIVREWSFDEASEDDLK